MSIEIKVPALPESVTDAVIAKWYKQEGDSVSMDENLVDLETDKVMLEIPATASGVIEKIIAPEGATVGSDAVIALIKEGAVAAPKAEAKSEAKEAAPAAAEKSAPAAEPESHDELSPAVRRLVSQHNIDISKVSGSGKNGRVVKADIEKFLQGGASVAATAAPAAARTEERVPMSRVRQKVAERMLTVQHDAAILTTFNEVNMKAVMDLRAKYKERFEKVHDTRLGFMSFFTAACVEALKLYPDVNASIDGSDIVYHNYFDIGIAVGSDRGLVVPILRDAQDMSLATIESTIREFAGRARVGKVTIEEMTGGTFTITNGGTYGSMMSTPILNAPQSAILGMHNIVERPVAENGEVVIRPMMYLALSYDHRIIDGKAAVEFLVTVKNFLEDPSRLLLGV